MAAPRGGSLYRGGVTRAAGTPVKTEEGKAGGVKPAAACSADPEAAAGGAQLGAAAVGVCIQRRRETQDQTGDKLRLGQCTN